MILNVDQFVELFPQFNGKHELIIGAELQLFTSEFGKVVALYEGLDFGKAFGESLIKSTGGIFVEWATFFIAKQPTNNVPSQQIITTFGNQFYARP